MTSGANSSEKHEVSILIVEKQGKISSFILLVAD